MLTLEENIELIKKIVSNEEDYYEIVKWKNQFISKLDVTIIIPSFNRPEYIKRSIKYYSLFDFMDVIYLEGSDNPVDLDFSNYSNIKYKHIPGLSLGERTVQGLKQVKTKYVITCADDDFVPIQALLNGIKCLDSKDYDVYLGDYWFFTSDEKGFNLIKRRVKNDIDIRSDNKWIRGFKHFKRYVPCMWGLATKDMYLKAYELMSRGELNNHNYRELLVSVYFARYGNGFDQVWWNRAI